MITMSNQAFDDAVADALDAVPARFLDLLENVVFLVEDEPPVGWGDDVFGLYEGTPLTDRWGPPGPPILPDRITIFRGPTLRSCTDVDQVRHEITVTVIHEIAHHFGIPDARLHELGWG